MSLIQTQEAKTCIKGPFLQSPTVLSMHAECITHVFTANITRDRGLQTAASKVALIEHTTAAQQQLQLLLKKASNILHWLPSAIENPRLSDWLSDLSSDD